MTHGYEACIIGVSCAGRYVHLSSLSQTIPALTLFTHETRLGTIIHPLRTGRDDNTRCRAMEKQAGQQSASLPWATVPHPIPGITVNSPKGNAQCGKIFEDLHIWSSCPTGAGNPWCSRTTISTATAQLMGIHHSNCLSSLRFAITLPLLSTS